MSIKNTRILGFGSEMLSDEGLAVRLVHDLKRKWHVLSELNTYLCFSLDVVHEMAGCQKLLLIDTMEGKEAGSVKKFTLENYIPTLHLNNYHDVSLQEGFQFGNKLGLHMPSNVLVIAIAIKKLGYISNLMSPEIEMNYAKIFSEVENMIEENIYHPV